MFSKSVTLAQYDPDLAAAIAQEDKRQQDHVELIASENYVSCAVMEAQGSQLTNKYAEGYPGKRYYGGCEYVDIVEQLAIDRVKELFGAALRLASQPSRVRFCFKTGRYHFGHVSGTRRPLDPRCKR
mgnify:CR=1 FL=1